MAERRRALTPLATEVISTATGLAAVGAAFALGVPVLVTLPLGLAAYAGARLALPPSAQAALERAAGLPTQADLENEIAAARARIAEIRRSASSPDAAAVRENVEEICLFAEDIVAGTALDPASLSLLRSVRRHHLEITSGLIGKYTRLSQREVDSVQPALDKAVSVIASIRDSIAALHERIAQDEALNLEAEVEALEEFFKEPPRVSEESK
jgi:hypothetical protein